MRSTFKRAKIRNPKPLLYRCMYEAAPIAVKKAWIDMRNGQGLGVTRW